MLDCVEANVTIARDVKRLASVTMRRSLGAPRVPGKHPSAFRRHRTSKTRANALMFPLAGCEGLSKHTARPAPQNIRMAELWLRRSESGGDNGRRDFLQNEPNAKLSSAINECVAVCSNVRLDDVLDQIRCRPRESGDHSHGPLEWNPTRSASGIWVPAFAGT